MRSATYRDGVITLDRPVKEMFGPIYQRLYTVAFEGTEHLLPSANVAEFEEQASSRLNEINKIKPLPWNLSFSYSRALQEPCMKVWQGKDENKEKAQQEFAKRLKLNSLASKGEYTSDMEDS